MGGFAAESQRDQPVFVYSPAVVVNSPSSRSQP